MIFIEKLLEIYDRYRAVVLNPVVIVAVLTGALYEFCSLNRKRENIEEPLLRSILLSLTAVCIGWIFYAAGVFCKTFLHKIAKTFCRSLQLHFVGNCKPGWQSWYLPAI